MPGTFEELGRNRLVRQLKSISVLTPEDEAKLAALPFRISVIGQQHDITREGARPSECCLVIDGLVCRYKMVVRGRRQILSLHHPGDIPDLQSLVVDRMDHGLAALARTVVAFIPHEAIRDLVGGSANLERVFRRRELADASILREWIANIGQRDARMRIGHLLCEVYTRLHALGLDQAKAIRLDMTQADLGEAAGLSQVHVNRVLQRLRCDGLIASHGRHHTILDWLALQHASDFDPAYLHLRTA